MNNSCIQKAGDIISKNTGELSYCSLGLIDLDGYPTVSTISASKAQGIEWITFCTGIGSTKVERVRHNNRASVCFNGADYNITLVGTMEIVTDSNIKKEMWYSGLANHFSGPEDPNFCVLRFKTRRYNLLIDWEEVRGEIEE